MKTNHSIPIVLAVTVASGVVAGLLHAADHPAVGYTDTPMLPGGKCPAR